MRKTDTINIAKAVKQYTMEEVIKAIVTTSERDVRLKLDFSKYYDVMIWDELNNEIKRHRNISKIKNNILIDTKTLTVRQLKEMKSSLAPKAISA